MKNSVLNAAIHLLKYRYRSCQEIKNRLIQKGYSEDDILNTVNHLTNLGYLNDEYFANIYVLDKLKQNGVGPIYLQIELRKHEIPQLVIDEAIASGYNKIFSNRTLPFPEIIFFFLFNSITFISFLSPLPMKAL